MQGAKIREMMGFAETTRIFLTFLIRYKVVYKPR